MYKWDAGEALQLIERERPKQWTGVPTMVQDLMEHPGEFENVFSNLRNLYSLCHYTKFVIIVKIIFLNSFLLLLSSL